MAQIRNDRDAARAERPGAQFVRYFGPVLDALRALGDSGTSDEVIERVAKDLRLSDSVLNELLPSGGLRYRNKVHWARFYLAREGLIDSSRRGVWSLTENGRKMHLDDTQARALFLRWVRTFQELRKTRTEDASAPSDGITPQAGDLQTDYKSNVAWDHPRSLLIRFRTAVPTHSAGVRIFARRGN